MQNSKGLQLSPIQLKEDYVEKWNAHQEDFVILTKNEIPLRNTLYRKGGMFNEEDLKKKYFILIKYTEAIYDYDFIKDTYKDASNKEIEKRRKYLKSSYCIIDENGNEVKYFDQIHYPRLIGGGPVYSFSDSYYNIETGEFYCRPLSSMESESFLFLDNCFGKDKSKIGVMKICKKTGAWELFQ